MIKNNEKPLILVVEDDSGILENLKLLLNFNNFSVLTAENGREALDKLSKMQESLTFPDLILSDIVMPKIDGYTFFKIISNFSPWNKIPFIFLSALSYPEDIQLAKSLGVEDYITKPFKEEVLIASIKSKLDDSKKNMEFTNKTVENSFNDLDLIRIFQKIQAILFHVSLTKKNHFKIINIYPNSKETYKLVHLFSEKIINKFGSAIEISKSENFLFTNFLSSNIQATILFDKFNTINKEQNILGFLSTNLRSSTMFFNTLAFC